ncbi:MAG: hypothetical protein JWO05_2598 [Gemmatimonadetes bacterium]|nr:hypothetical protein [Gemmatimonadota bacterium]
MSRDPLLLLSLTVVAACGGAHPKGPAQASPQPKSRAGVVQAVTVASGLEHPWALQFLPDGRLLVTERPGRLRLVTMDGHVSSPITGVPAVYHQGQGGLLDVAIDPDFTSNHLVYLSFSEPEGSVAGTSVMRGVLRDSSLDSVQVIYRQQPKVGGGAHFGSRLVFARDGTLFITQGERYDFRARAQQLDSDLGKVVRVNRDGSLPRDNPFRGQRDALPEIWSYGHRNVQAAALDPTTGRLWTVEHGAMGGDELNHPEAGKNYGWPVITYGVDYNGRHIGQGAEKEGMEQPVYYWDPVIAPSGMAFYTGDAMPGWKGSILIGSLAGSLVRLTMANGRVTSEERYLGELGERIRDVQVGPDGLVYLVTDNEKGRVLRVSPAPRKK